MGRLLTLVAILGLASPACVLPKYHKRSTAATESGDGAPNGGEGGGQADGAAQEDGGPADQPASNDAADRTPSYDAPEDVVGRDVAAGVDALAVVDGATEAARGEVGRRDARPDGPTAWDGGPSCTPDEEPAFSFLDGFESYPPGGYIAAAAGSRWRTLPGSSQFGQVTTTWATSCSQALFVQTPGQVVYAPVQTAAQASKLNIEFLYAPMGGELDAAELGLGSVSGALLSKVFSIRAHGTDLVVATPWAAPTTVPANLATGSDVILRPPRNYVRVELDFCAVEARIFVGRDASAPLVQTVNLGGAGPFDVVYVSGGGRSTYLDDLAVWTPGTSLDRSMLCGAQLIEKVTSPGSRCSGIAWDGDHLWMLDNLRNLYRIGDATGVQLDFQGYGLSWDGVGFWTRNTSAGFGEQIVRVRPNGVVEPGPNIFAQAGFSDSNGQAQWLAPGYFWVLSTTYGFAELWSLAGLKVRDWAVSGTTFLTGVLLRDQWIYFATGIWFNSSDEDAGMVKYDLTGVRLGMQNLSQLGLPHYQGRYSLATDGNTYWICSEAALDIYHVKLPF